MFRHIENIQQKPEYVRRRIALFLTVIFFAIIMLSWLAMLNIESVKKEEAGRSVDIVTPFANLKESFSGMTKEVGDKINSIKDQF